MAKWRRNGEIKKTNNGEENGRNEEIINNEIENNEMKINIGEMSKMKKK